MTAIPNESPRRADGAGLAVRAVMHRGVAAVKPGDSVHWAAERMRDWNVGALPVCDDDDRAVGIITDRDIVVLARRLPVTERGRVIGMISEGDIVGNLAADAVGLIPQNTVRAVTT